MPSYCPFALKIRLIALLTAGKRKGTGVYEDIFVSWIFTTFCTIFFFFLCFFFTHDIHPHLRPTPTTHTHDPRPITHTHDFYPSTLGDLFTCGDIMFSHESSPDVLFLFIYITIIHDLSHTFFKRNYYEVKLHVKSALRFLQITAKHQDCPFFTVFLTIKTSSQNISITLLQISLKLREHRGGYCRKKLQ